MLGPALEMLLDGKCGGCGRSDIPLFNVDTSQLTDYAILFRVCRYCRDILSTKRGRDIAMEHWTWFCINAHSPATNYARQQAAIAFGKEYAERRALERERAAEGWVDADTVGVEQTA